MAKADNPDEQFSDLQEEAPSSTDSGEASGGEAEPKPPLFRRFGIFLKGCVTELGRVKWPNRPQVVQATGVVIGFVALAGAYLGLLDFLFLRLVRVII